MTYPKSYRRGRRTLPRVNLRHPASDAQAQCDRCSHWVQHSSLREQLEYRGGSAPAGTGVWVCGRCYDVPNPVAVGQSGSYVAPPGGAFNAEVLRQDPEPVMNARPDNTTYQLDIPAYPTGSLPNPVAAPYQGYQIYVTGIALDAVLCYSDGDTWRNFETGAVVT